MLFQQEFDSSWDLSSSFELFKSSFQIPDEVGNYARSLLEGIQKHRSQIDETINTHSTNWSLQRMALVDANIMRIAVYEIMLAQDPVPPAAAINEAVEIAKKYSTVDSSQFINGILDQISLDPK